MLVAAAADAGEWAVALALTETMEALRKSVLEHAAYSSKVTPLFRGPHDCDWGV